MPFENKKLVRESDWMRVYEISDPKGYLFESKFLIDNLQVSPSTIKERWLHLSEGEKIEFASAFSSQPPRHADDQQILDFLMGVGPEEVWRAIANLLPFCPDRDRALEFLVDRVRQAPERRANYYQTIELLRGESAILLLRQRYDEYRKLLTKKSQGSDQFDVWMDYLQCSKTLWTLTQDPTFLSALKEGQTTAPPELRPSAARLLREVEKI
jgi:hypothetical protein